MINKDFNLDKFKKQSAKVSDFLKQKKHPIPKTTLLHALSIFLEEKDWNTLSAKLTNKKIEKITDEKEDQYFSILYQLYLEIFGEKFPFFEESVFSENIYNITKNTKESLKKYKIIEHKNTFPEKQGLINNMNLIGDEQILKITMSYNNKYQNDSENLFNFLISAFYYLLHPLIINSTDIGNDVLSNPISVRLESRYRTKIYFFVPLSLKEDFISLNKSNFATGGGISSFGSSSLNINSIKDTQKISKISIIEKLSNIGIEDINSSCCFLNNNYIDEFLKTR